MFLGDSKHGSEVGIPWKKLRCLFTYVSHMSCIWFTHCLLCAKVVSITSCSWKYSCLVYSVDRIDCTGTIYVKLM